MVFQPYAQTFGARQFGPAESVAGERWLFMLDEPVRMFGHPAGIDGGVVRHLVGNEAHPVAGGLVPQPLQCFLSAQFRCDDVIMDRVGRSDRVRLAFQLLDETRGAAPLPDADQPQSSDAGLAQRREFGSRDLIQAGYATAVTPTQLVQPVEAVAGV